MASRPPWLDADPALIADPPCAPARLPLESHLRAKRAGAAMKRENAVTIKDVAKAAGVHLSTVSRALNPATRGRISEEVVAQVEEVARRLGYRRNQMASGLRTKRSNMVGVIVPDITNPMFPPILKGIEDVLREADYTAIVANTDGDPKRQATVVERLQGQHIDGLILATATRKDPLVIRLKADGLPLVVVNRNVDEEGVSSVVNDDARGIRMAVDHLVGLGHRRIAHIAGPQDLSTGHVRRWGFLEALQGHGLEPDKALVVAVSRFAQEDGRTACLTLLDRRGRHPFTAVVAANDLLALGACQALRERGLACPGDVSVTGFNDMPLVDRLNPPLTTVRIQHYQIGVQAARMLLGQFAGSGEAATGMRLVLAPELKVRGSTAPPREPGAEAGPAVPAKPRKAGRTA